MEAVNYNYNNLHKGSTFSTQFFNVRNSNTNVKESRLPIFKVKSFIRLSAFGSKYSNISIPTWLPELSQTILIFLKFGPWISFATIPSEEPSATISTGPFITVKPSISWLHDLCFDVLFSLLS